MFMVGIIEEFIEEKQCVLGQWKGYELNKREDMVGKEIGKG